MYEKPKVLAMTGQNRAEIYIIENKPVIPSPGRSASRKKRDKKWDGIFLSYSKHI
jgi:hypothetical protein